MRQAAWAGAGFAAGHYGGPAGSLGFGSFRHRHELAAGGGTRNRAIVKVVAPVAASVAFGPAGTVGYQAFAHRRWIKHHLWPHRKHKPRRAHSRA